MGIGYKSDLKKAKEVLIRLGENDPAGNYLKYAVLDYLKNRNYVAAPEWSPETLKTKSRMENRENFIEVQIDEGGRAKE